MSFKPYEHVVNGDPRLLERLAKEDPEFIIEDATSSGSCPPASSPEAQIFIKAAEGALHQLNQQRETTTELPNFQ